jgi:hypothetical protein
VSWLIGFAWLSGWRVALTGGDTGHGSLDGAFYLRLNNASSDTGSNFSGRLAYGQA